MEDELRFGADHYLKKLLERKSFLESFWGGIKVTCVFMALFLSIFAVYKATALAKPVSRFGAVSSRLDGDERALKNAQKRAEKTAKFTKLINETVAHLSAPPVMFDCYRTQRMVRAGIVNYDGCFVDTTKGAMSTRTGIFTVGVAGVYQLSFTAKYVSSSKGRFGAWSDMYVNNTVVSDSQREYNNNDINSSESSTHSVVVIYALNVGDRVRVQFNKDGNSYIHSDADHDVHFTAFRISKLPETTSGR